MFARVVLDRIVDNPFQTRQEYGNLHEMVDSIVKMAMARPETSGLIQIPPARIVIGDRVLDPNNYGGVEACLGDEPNAMVQLAAGHRRLRAFRFLAAVGNGDYQSFPVEIQNLDDQAMADIAWQENLQRQDLTAIEEAEAIRKAMDAFGWKLEEVRERWGLSKSAVSNKLRLLKLPEEAQAAIRAGQITERHGRVLLRALGKSERIYELAALDILPLPVDEATVARAREVVGDNRIYEVNLSVVKNLAEQRCAVCGGPVGHPASGQVSSLYDYSSGEQYFCLACARAAQGWEVPTTALAEDVVERTIRDQSNLLDPNFFPLRREIEAKSYTLNGVTFTPELRAPVCVECSYMETLEQMWCLDRACFHDKEELHYSWQANQLALAIRKRWLGEAIPPIVRDWGGRDLASYSEVEKAMVESGHCGPHCERLRFRYAKNFGSNIRFEDSPFVFNCDNANAFNACQKRYLKSLESEDQAGSVVLAAKLIGERKKAARERILRAEASVAHALLQEHGGAWAGLARALGAEGKQGQSLAESVGQIARVLIGGKGMMGYVTWEDEGVEERFGNALESVLRRLGVGLLPGVEELAEKLERVKGFLLGEDGLPRAGLTEAQIKGNLANLEKIAETVRQVVESEQDRERLLGWVESLKELFSGE